MASNVVVQAVLWVTIFAFVARADNYCCSPPQFVMQAGQLQGLVIAGKGLPQINNIALALDFNGKRVGEEIVSTTAGHTTNLKVIIDYNKNVMYTITNGQTCTKSDAPDDYNQCIPKTARYDGGSTLGDNEMIIDNFSYYENIPKVFAGNVSVGVARKGCILVRTGLIGMATQTQPPIPLVSGTGYANYKAGISDPDRWFTVPSICQQGESGRFARYTADMDSDTQDTHHLVTLINRMVLAPFNKN